MTPSTFQNTRAKLSLHYFLYFAVLGTILPYLALYFQALGLTAIEIGQLLGIMMFTKVIAPNIWGWLADRSGNHIYWVKLATALTTFAGTGLLVFEDFWPLFFTLLLFSFFWHASLPQFESYTFTSLGEDKHRYGEVRLWGSIGFIVAVLLFGWQLEHWSISWVPIDIFILLIAVWASSYLFKAKAIDVEHSNAHKFIAIVKRPEVMALLIISFLVQFSHGVYYTFYTIQLTDLGYEKTTIAWLWALGVIAEIAVFIWMSKLFRRYAIAYLILISIVLTLMRWLMIGYFSDSFLVLFIAQLLHAASFGLFHAAAIFLIDQYFYGKHHGKGQALFAASSHGLGGAVGMFTAGYAWAAGGAELGYGISILAVILAFFITLKWVK